MKYTLLLLILISTISYSKPPQFKYLSGGGADFHFESVTFNKQTASDNLIDNKGKALSIAMNIRVQEYLELNAGYRHIFVDDFGQFSQTVTDGYGYGSNTEVKSTSMGIDTLFIEMGVGVDVLSHLDVSLMLGTEGLSGSRSINDCIDCGVDVLDIHGGAYIKPTARIWLYKTKEQNSHGETIYLGLVTSYNKSLGDRFIDDHLAIGLTFGSKF